MDVGGWTDGRTDAHGGTGHAAAAAHATIGGANNESQDGFYLLASLLLLFPRLFLPPPHTEFEQRLGSLARDTSETPFAMMS